MAKTKFCPVSREQFRKVAKDMIVTIGGNSRVATAREFSTGSFGWFLNEKVIVTIDGVSVTCQVGLNITVIGSKDLPKD